MNTKRPTFLRTLSIAPSTRGFGFAVVEGPEVLVDWGVKTVQGDKNTGSLKKIAELIAHYRPEILVLQDYEAKDSRRAPRIRKLGQQIITLAGKRNVRVRLCSSQQIKRAFFADGGGTKHQLAELLAKRFPEELGSRLPPKRKPWMSEDCRMDIFDAVALALTPRLRNRSRAEAKR